MIRLLDDSPGIDYYQTYATAGRYASTAMVMSHKYMSRELALTVLLAVSEFAPFLLPAKMAFRIMKHQVNAGPPYGLISDDELGIALAVPYDRKLHWRTSPWSLRHIPFLDLEPVFGGMCSYRQGLCLPDDNRHWNEKGHAVVAGEILQFLRRERLIPAAKVI